MEERINHFAVGIFILTLIVGMVITMMWLLRSSSDKNNHIYEVYFQGSVSGLREGSQVRYRGVPVGVVKKIGIDQHDVERVKVKLGIRPEMIIKEDAVASLEMQGLTGVAYVQISGGTQASPTLKAKKGEKHPVLASKSSHIERVFESAPEMLSSISVLVEDIHKIFNQENRQGFTDIIQNLATISGVFSDKSDDLKTLITEMHKGLTQLSKTLSSFEGSFNNLGKDAQQTLVSVSAVLEENRGSIRNFTGIGLDQLTKLIGDLRTSVAGLNRIIDRIERSPSRFLFGTQENQDKGR